MANASYLAGLDVLVPEQHFEQFDKTSQIQPEKQLMFAVLLDAVECFQVYAPSVRRKPDRLFKYSEEWIFEDDHKWPFSFINICEALGIDPQYLRKGLLDWKETRLSRSDIYPPRPLITRPSGAPKAQITFGHWG